MDSDEQRESADTAAAPRSGRRLADRILAAVHTACDQGELEVAEQLLRVMHTLVAQRPPAADNRRRLMEAVVAAHERLWHLRHPDAGEP